MSAIFNYTARSLEGRFVAGAIQADSSEYVLSHLRARSLFVTSLEEARSPRGLATRAFSIFPVSASAKLAFFRSFATLIGAGVSIRRALDVTIEQCHDRRLMEALRSVAADIESGETLSSAMGRRPREFSPLVVAMLRAGEIGGALDQVFGRLADLLDRENALRKRLSAALTYPAIVTLAAAGLVLFLIANTAPAFAGMFAELRVELPLSTRLLIAAGGALKSPVLWAGILVLVFGLYILWNAARRSSNTRVAMDGLKLHIPVVGNLLRKVAVAQFARTLGTLLKSGVSLVGALDAVEDVVQNYVYKRSVSALTESLRRGEPLTAPLESSGLFDSVFLQLVRVGEETGALDSMLLRLSQYYEIDIETAITTLGSALEPLLIVFLGAVVGTIVASILIPLYSMIGSIK